MRLDEQPGEAPARRSGPATPVASKGREAPAKRSNAPAARSGGGGNAGNSAMSDALAAALGKKR